MGRTACTEPQCLYKGALYLFMQEPVFMSVSQCFVVCDVNANVRNRTKLGSFQMRVFFFLIDDAVWLSYGV